jgi:hypothetical protein
MRHFQSLLEQAHTNQCNFGRNQTTVTDIIADPSGRAV